MLKGTEMSPPKPSTTNVTPKPRERSATLAGLSSSTRLPSKYQQSSSIKIPVSAVSANDPITIETSSMGITDLREPLCTDATTQMTATFQSANATLGELTEKFHTANDEFPPSNPCASSTRRKEVLTVDASDESIKFTKGSSLLLLQTKKYPYHRKNSDIPTRYRKPCPKSWLR